MSGQIVWAIVIGFLAGVFIRTFVLLSWPFALLFLVVAAVASFFLLAADSKRRSLTVCIACCVAFSLGIVRMDHATRIFDPELHAKLGSTISVEGTIVAEPDVRETGTRLSVRVDALIVGSSSMPVRAGVLVLAPPHVSVAYGDVVHAEGKLRLPEAFDAGEGRTFDYPMYLAKDGILYELAFAQVETTGERHANPLKSMAIRIKQFYLAGLQSVLPEPEAGLAGGITVGDKRSIGPELSDVFRRASLVHIVVLSGYNITVVLNATSELLSRLPRTVRSGANAGIVLFFVLMTGGAASAVRAGAMALLAAYARLSGRQFLALRILGVVATVMVIWNPFMLVYDPSFQLSVLATLGLILFTPVISRWLSFLPEKFGIREIIASTLGTQLAVLPLLLYQNGNLSLVSLPANLLALIPVPYAMFASFIAAIFGIIFGSHAIIIGFPAYVLLGYIIWVAKTLASLPFAAVTIPAFGAWALFGAYVGLFVGYMCLKKYDGER